MIANYSLLAELNRLLTPEKYQDYCPNGLQVEGTHKIQRIITGVSLTEQLIEVAIAEGAQAIMVHHGIFWHKDDYNIVGIKQRRIAKLLKYGINLYAYHLPLDNHPELGNNVQLAKKIGVQVLGQTDKQGLLWFGRLNRPASVADFIAHLSAQLQHNPLYFTNSETQVLDKVAWCTGGADSLFNAAINLGVTAYITGEVSEPIMSLAAESGVVYIAAGHYATERYGIYALTQYLQDELGLSAKFIELYNPV